MMDKIKFELDIIDVLRRHDMIGKTSPKYLRLELDGGSSPNIEMRY